MIEVRGPHPSKTTTDGAAVLEELAAEGPCEINFTINLKSESNGGGQECPPHTDPKSESLP
jgi:hypothetical protein